MNAILKRHKGIFTTLAVSIPGVDMAVQFLDNLGLDLESVITIAASADPKYWAYSGIAVAYMYVSERANKEDTQAEKALKLVEKVEADVQSALSLIKEKSEKA